MQSRRARLDRFISARLDINRGDVRLMLAQGRVKVNGHVAVATDQLVDQFSCVEVDKEVLQNNTPKYIMMNKPLGVVSATKDHKHKTVIDFLDGSDREQLHITGRLDFNSTGLMLLTNDGRWSRRLSMPETKVTKRYRVTLEKPLTQDYVTAFAEGMHFAYEGITTLPATLKIISDHVAEVGLVEGRYHQIKRMFGRFQNKVLALHRVAIGNLKLDPSLSPGQSRELVLNEVANIIELT
jgi:16S rRNA pseudouridine516 synthase